MKSKIYSYTARLEIECPHCETTHTSELDGWQGGNSIWDCETETIDCECGASIHVDSEVSIDLSIEFDKPTHDEEGNEIPEPIPIAPNQIDMFTNKTVKQMESE